MSGAELRGLWLKKFAFYNFCSVRRSKRLVGISIGANYDAVSGGKAKYSPPNPRYSLFFNSTKKFEEASSLKTNMVKNKSQHELNNRIDEIHLNKGG